MNKILKNCTKLNFRGNNVIIHNQTINSNFNFPNVFNSKKKLHFIKGKIFQKYNIKPRNKDNNNPQKENNDIKILNNILSIKKFSHKNHRINNTYDEMKVKQIKYFNKNSQSIEKIKKLNIKNNIENEYFKINKDKTILPELLLKPNLKNFDKKKKKKNCTDTNTPKNVEQHFIHPKNDIRNKMYKTNVNLNNLNYNSQDLYNYKIDINKHIEEASPIKLRREKVSINNVKNIIKGSNIINNKGKDEKIVNIRLKDKNYFSRAQNFNFTKTKEEGLNFCMSNYNNFKDNLIGLKKIYHHFENEEEKRTLLINKNQTMFKNPFFDMNYITKTKEDEIDTKNYSKYFLPSSGFGLLNRRYK